MIAVITRLTVRQLLGRGRTLLMAGVALLPIVLAVVYRAGSEDGDQQRWVARVLFEGLVVTSLLPLAALVFGTAALGAEIEDGTAVYLLTKPIPRSRIIVAKVLAAWFATSITVVVSGVAAGAIGLVGAFDARLLGGFAVALVAGSLVYTSLFVLLSVATSRALIAGLAYVFVWEGLVNGLFAGTRLLSVRHYTLAVADLVAGVPGAVFDAKLAATPAVALVVVVCSASLWLAVRRLRRFEIGETT